MAKLKSTDYIFLLVLSVSIFWGCLGYGSEENKDTEMGHTGAGEVDVERVKGTEINMSMLMKKMIEIAVKKYGHGEI